MEFLKALFSNGPLTFEQFEAAVREQKMNIVNLADGGYVSKSKYDDTVNGLKGQVTELQGQITSRDGDLTFLREQLRRRRLTRASSAPFSSPSPTSRPSTTPIRPTTKTS